MDPCCDPLHLTTIKFVRETRPVVITLVESKPVYTRLKAGGELQSLRCHTRTVCSPSLSVIELAYYFNAMYAHTQGARSAKDMVQWLSQHDLMVEQSSSKAQAPEFGTDLDLYYEFRDLEEFAFVKQWGHILRAFFAKKGFQHQGV
eukprot:PhF_6_TR40370/c0_g1_i4/m.60099